MPTITTDVLNTKRTGQGTCGLEICEDILFKRNEDGLYGIDFFSLDQSLNMSDEEALKALGPHKRSRAPLIPDMKEPDAVRHFTRLSKKNCAIDVSSYPLGSCTMKYNPKLHEWVASLPGLMHLHPYFFKKDLQPALEIMYELQIYLREIGGFHSVSLAPSAGAQGEFAGIAMIKQALHDRNEERKTILVPKSAHGTNAATAAFFSYEVIPLEINTDGRIIMSELSRLMDKHCAGIMITNPNTMGIFESEQKAISDLVHERGGFVYGDGANLNALMGIARPGDLGIDVMHFNLHKTMTTPHGGGGPGCGAIGANSTLAPYLPVPRVIKADNSYELCLKDKSSIGRIRSFFGNFGMMIRAWTYIRSLGPNGLKAVSEHAVLNANYIKEKLKPYYHLPYKEDCLHEVVFSDQYQLKSHVSTLDIAKRLIDYGIHPPTIYFPLIVKGAMMIEPTETESIHDLDHMIEAFIAVAQEAKTNPELIKSAPHHTALSRLDETQAARYPQLIYENNKESK